jgi:hypothetical protein
MGVQREAKGNRATAKMTKTLTLSPRTKHWKRIERERERDEEDEEEQERAKTQAKGERHRINTCISMVFMYTNTVRFCRHIPDKASFGTSISG